MAIKSTSPLAGLLRKSPFKPVQEHMRVVISCVQMLPELFDGVYEKNQEEVQRLAREINSRETEADKIKSAFRGNMPNTLLLPVDRKDLLSLINEQDSIADGAEKIGQILESRDMLIPAAIKESFEELLKATVAICEQAQLMIEELDELVHVGFSGREHERVTAMIKVVRKEEHSIDAVLRKVNRTLFMTEKELDPVSVMFWYKIIEELGDISDHAENMADRLLLFLSK